MVDINDKKFAYKDKENTFEKANTFNKGVVIGSTSLTSASLTNIVDQTNKVPTIEQNITDLSNNITQVSNDLTAYKSSVDATYRKIANSYTKQEVDNLLNQQISQATLTAGEGIKIESNVISVEYANKDGQGHQIDTYYLPISSFSWTELSGKPTNISAFTNDVGYITTSALSSYATQTYVQEYVKQNPKYTISLSGSTLTITTNY